jgi:hypothetical protein
MPSGPTRKTPGRWSAAATAADAGVGNSNVHILSFWIELYSPFQKTKRLSMENKGLSGIWLGVIELRSHQEKVMTKKLGVLVS